MTEQTHFDRAAERAVVDHTNELLNELVRLALRYAVDKQTVERACRRYSGEDLVDCWFNFIAEAGL